MVRNEHNGNTIGHERSQRSLDENENHSGTAVKGFRKSEYERDFMAVPSINYGVTCVRNEHHGAP